jgi:5'-nucleotidase
LLRGGNHRSGPFLEETWPGARYPTLAANVVDEASGHPVLPPYVVKRVIGVPIGFIELVLEQTPTIVTPSGVAGARRLPGPALHGGARGTDRAGQLMGGCVC